MKVEGIGSGMKMDKVREGWMMAGTFELGRQNEDEDEDEDKVEDEDEDEDLVYISRKREEQTLNYRVKHRLMAWGASAHWKTR